VNPSGIIRGKKLPLFALYCELKHTHTNNWIAEETAMTE
jgi:hypothetical protein